MKKEDSWDDNFDDFLDSDFYDTSSGLPMNRREFLKLMGGGIVILFSVGDPLELLAQRQRGQPLPDDFNSFLKIPQSLQGPDQATAGEGGRHIR